MASANDLRSLEKDPRLFLYTSLTAGSSHIITATSRLETILKANRIPFQAVDIATDEQARKLWQRRAGKKKLPGLVKEGFIIGDYDEVEEWNEYGELKDNIGPLPTTGAAVGVAPKILPVKPTATAGSANITAKPAVDTSRMVALPGAAEIAARNKIVQKSSTDAAAKAESTAKTEEPIKAEKMTAAADEKEKSIEKAVEATGDDEQAEKSEKAAAEKEDIQAAKEPTAEEKTTGSAAIKQGDTADLAKPSVAAEAKAPSKQEPIVAESAGATTITETEKTPEPVASKEVPIETTEQESENVAPLTPITNTPPQRRSTVTKSPPDTAIGENIVPVNVAAAADLKDSLKEKMAADTSTSKSLSNEDGQVDATKSEEVDPETVEPAAEEGAEAKPTVGTTAATTKDTSKSSTTASDEKKSAETAKSAATASPIASTDTGVPEGKKSEAAKEGAAIFNEVRDDALSNSSNTAASPAVTAFKDTSSTATSAKTDVAKEHNGAQVKFAPETEIKKMEEKTSIPEEKEEAATGSTKAAEGTTIASTVQAAVTSTKEIVKDVVEEVKKVTVDSKSQETEKESEPTVSKSTVDKDEKKKETAATASSKTQNQPAAEPKLAEKSVED